MPEVPNPSPEASHTSSSPESLASKGSSDRIDATKIGLLAVTSMISPVAGIGLLTFFAVDTVTGGMLTGSGKT